MVKGRIREAIASGEGRRVIGTWREGKRRWGNGLFFLGSGISKIPGWYNLRGVVCGEEKKRCDWRWYGGIGGIGFRRNPPHPDGDISPWR